MLELRHLRSIRAIAETNKLGLAAERVFLTQSALSHQIRALETHYGITLFQRTAQGLRFTPAGQCFLDLANELLPAVEKTERDLIRLKSDQSGELRIVLECHTCFDWLTPVMDVFRRAWPEVELDLVAGFHSDPWSLIDAGKADLVIGSPPAAIRELASRPLFRFEIMAVLPPEHSLSNRRYLQARDFSEATLLTYPVPEARIDLIAKVLKPAGIAFERRTAELTVAIMQLVASRRGIAALPNWSVQSYLERDYVRAKSIGRKGLWSALYAATTEAMATSAYLRDFLDTVRSTSFRSLRGLLPLS